MPLGRAADPTQTDLYRGDSEIVYQRAEAGAPSSNARWFTYP